jgi:metal-responsive CopG/Arc/MetJ family transcriptional regulator
MISIIIDLPPAEEKQLTDAATREGVSVSDLIQKAIRSYLPKKGTTTHINAATLALIKQWEEEDANMTLEEIQKNHDIYSDIEKFGIPKTRI